MDQPRPNPKWIMYVFGLIIAFIVISWLAGIYTDYLWMKSVGQGAVFVKILSTKVGLGLVVGVIFFLWLYLNLRVARKPLPADVTFVGRRLLPDEERAQIEQHADRALLLLAGAGALLAALVASGKWRDYLQMAHAVNFGSSDPTLGIETGFYVFKLSFIQYAWRSLLYGVLIAFALSTLVHLYQETIRLVGNTVHAMPRARLHLFSLLALALFIKIYDYRLMQFNLLYSTRGGFFAGPGYADMHANYPVLFLMMAVALGVGVLMLISIRQRGFKLAGWALGVLVVLSLLGGSVYPALIQQLVVKPNQIAVERPYVANNIKATNDAYNLSQVKNQTFPEAQPLTAQVVADNQETIKSIRLWDHRPLETTYDQKQGLRAYYKFSDVDVDRYTINGEYRQVMLAARELNYAKLPSQTWVNKYLTYTHGYGLGMSPVHEATGGGMPEFWIKDLPPQSLFPELTVRRPGLYYMTAFRPRLIEMIAPPEQRPTPPDVNQPGGPQAGMQYSEPPPAGSEIPQVEQTPFVIVNTKNPELDYARTDQQGQDATTHYAGTGGVPVDSFLARVAFAIRFRDLQILLTGYIQPGSQLLMNRYVPDRLAAIMPYPLLVYDPDPYLVLVDGELKWICDAYTVSRMYPYSTRKPELGGLNYMRNSVKAVVDAYDGRPVFYVADTSDPILQCYRQIFPTLFTDFAQMPANLHSHLRYPQLLFRVQAEVYSRYHMRDPGTFFINQDEWAIPSDLYRGRPRPMEAYYVILKLPGEQQAEFIQMLPMVLKGREDKNLVAWMAARSDAPHYGELIVYDFSAAESFLGPMQFESLVDAVPDISAQLSLWNQLGSQVIRGNTLVIPVAQSLLYVEPIYLVSTQAPFPTLQRVVLASGSQIVMEPTLAGALAKLFGQAQASPAAPPSGRQPQPGAAPSATPDKATQQALQLLIEADQLLRNNDLGGYQRKVEEARQLLAGKSTGGP